jgi:SAM-dependent methyltransferase
MRLQARKSHLWSGSYLAYRYLWPNLAAAVREAKNRLPSDSRIVLDVGCGNKPYADLFVDCLYFGANYSADNASPDIVADAMRLPIASQAIDLVFCSQVIEHVPQPWRLVEECHRVLKPGGSLVLSAPFYWPLHEQPHDYFRFTRYGLESLLLGAGFSECRIECDGGDAARFWLSAIHATPRWLRRFVHLPFNILGSVFDKGSSGALFPANYTVLARR